MIYSSNSEGFALIQLIDETILRGEKDLVMDARLLKALKDVTYQYLSSHILSIDEMRVLNSTITEAIHGVEHGR